MKSMHARELVAQSVIVATLCIGLPLLGVQPLRARLAEDASALDRALADSSASPGDSAMASSAPGRAKVDLLDRFATMNALSGDASTLYEKLMALAAAQGVTIERMQPAHVVVSREAEAMGDQASAYSIMAIADYEAMAKFILALDREMGFSAVVSFRLQPAAEPNTGKIQASIETIHRRFSLARPAPVANAATEATP